MLLHMIVNEGCADLEIVRPHTVLVRDLEKKCSCRTGGQYDMKAREMAVLAA